MEDQNREPGMGKINRILWYILGILTLIVVLVVILAVIRRGTGY